MKNYISISIAGSHGKTTTTTIAKTVVSAFKKTGYLIGDGEGYLSKDSEYLCVESDEFRRHFAAYAPAYAIITNIEIDHVDYFLDSNVRSMPKLVTGDAIRDGLRAVAQGPFRLVPYFDPGVWGGQWMKEICGLDPTADNYAWSFDGVPEENSLYLRIDDVRIEVPAQDLVLWRPVELLGMRNYCRFGAEFPIRFDFLDTMGGQNLSLQVHPLTEYIRSHFGMTYTQDESYYILDASEGGGVFLGLRDGVDRDAFEHDLRWAQQGGPSFPAEKYVNYFPAKKHDHFLIPAGTLHCSAANAMVLEISATPYNFSRAPSTSTMAWPTSSGTARPTGCVRTS